MNMANTNEMLLYGVELLRKRLPAERRALGIMYEFIADGCYCPCCTRTDDCEDDCTFVDDAPALAVRMAGCRAVLREVDKALA